MRVGERESEPGRVGPMGSGIGDSGLGVRGREWTTGRERASPLPPPPPSPAARRPLCFGDFLERPGDVAGQAVGLVEEPLVEMVLAVEEELLGPVGIGRLALKIGIGIQVAKRVGQGVAVDLHDREWKMGTARPRSARPPIRSLKATRLLPAPVRLQVVGRNHAHQGRALLAGQREGMRDQLVPPQAVFVAEDRQLAAAAQVVVDPPHERLAEILDPPLAVVLWA